MGHYVYYLPSVEELVEIYNSMGLAAFAKRYIKTEGLVGDSDSIEFVNQKIREYALTVKSN